MLRLAFIALFSCAVYAQNAADAFNKPPAGVDQALRARIKEFYQYHVKQQFRQAEALVADDTKEFFYSHNKPQYLTFEIVRIEYSEKFTRAKATMLTEQYIMMPGFMDKPMKVPSPSTWKLEKGKWCWYVDPESLKETPFGKMTAGPGATTGSLPNVLPTVESVLNKVKTDKPALTLKPGESAEVRFTNTAAGQMNLAVTGVPEGMEAKLDRRQLAASEVAVLTVQAGKDAKTGTVSVRVEQTLEVIQIQANIK